MRPSRHAPGTYLRETETHVHRNARPRIFAATLFTVTKRRKEPRCPRTDEWINTMWQVPIVECYL